MPANDFVTTKAPTTFSSASVIGVAGGQLTAGARGGGAAESGLGDRFGAGVGLSEHHRPAAVVDRERWWCVGLVHECRESSRVERDLDLGQGRCGSPLQLDEFGAHRRALDDDGERDAEREQNERRDPDYRRRDAASHSTTRR